MLRMGRSSSRTPLVQETQPKLPFPGRNIKEYFWISEIDPSKKFLFGSRAAKEEKEDFFRYLRDARGFEAEANLGALLIQFLLNRVIRKYYGRLSYNLQPAIHNQSSVIECAALEPEQNVLSLKTL